MNVYKCIYVHSSNEQYIHVSTANLLVNCPATKFVYIHTSYTIAVNVCVKTLPLE